jgi:predicted RNA-binding Zn ribbon-like protein
VRFAVVTDAVALLADGERLARLRRCPGRDCGWLFLDTSGRRRWCSMGACGSREKMRRMYARQRAAAA